MFHLVSTSWFGFSKEAHESGSRYLKNIKLRLILIILLTCFHSFLVFAEEDLQEYEGDHFDINVPIESMAAVYLPIEEQYLVVAGRRNGLISVSSWEVSLDEKVQRLSERTTRASKGPIISIAVSYDGKKVVSSSYDRKISWWKVKEDFTLEFESYPKPEASQLEHTSFINVLTFSPSNKQLISASEDKSLIIWDVETHKATNKFVDGHTAGIISVAFSPDTKFDSDGKAVFGHIVSGDRDARIGLWDLSNNPLGVARTQMGLYEGHSYVVNSLAFSPDGKKVISGSKDGSIRLWEVLDGKLIEIESWEEFGNRVTSLDFSPDGTKVVTGGQDNIIRLFSVKENALNLIGKSKKDAIKYSVSSIAFLYNDLVLCQLLILG